MKRDNREIFISNDWRRLILDEKEVKALIWSLDSSKFKISDGELSIAFLPEHDMCDTHEKFLNDATLTDVITFDGDHDMNFAGEICVSPDYALESCKIHNTTFSEELSLYIVHGYLHLYGLNDILEKDIKKMREGENFCMSLIKNANRLPKFSYGN